MSLPWSAELCEVVHRARMSSGHAGDVRPTTATILRAMLAVSSDARLFLRNEGIEENLFCAVANRTCAEQVGVLERVFLHASRAAQSVQQSELSPVHLLHAMTLEPDSEACAILYLLGLDLEHVRATTLRLATSGYATTASARAGARPRHDTLDHSWSGQRAGRSVAPPPHVAAPPSSPAPDRRQIAFHPALAGLLEEAARTGEVDTCDDEALDVFAGDDATPGYIFADDDAAYELFGADPARASAFDERLATARHEAWARPQTWGQSLYAPPLPAADGAESGAFPVIGNAGAASSAGSAYTDAAWADYAPRAELAWAPPADPWADYLPPALDPFVAPPAPPSPQPERPRTERGVPRPKTAALAPPPAPAVDRTTPLGTPRLDLGQIRRRAAPPAPAPAPDPSAGTAAKPAAPAKPADGPASDDGARGTRKSRRSRTARESQEETARSLAARLFLGGEGKAPRTTEPPAPPAGDAPRAERPGSTAPLASMRHGHGPTSGPARSPIIRVPQSRQRAAADGFDRFELDPKVFPTLARFGRNLLAEAREGRLDPVIGRDLEIEQLIDIVNKRRSNNPLLVGPAGVGKTAIVEGLARLMAHDVPPPGLEERTIVALDLGTLLCGTGLRGAFQERLIGIKREVKKARGRVVLFLDELHTWLGAGGGDSGSDASGELKIALARGELPCVGATTEDEFKRHIEADPAFERRFDVIDVRPPSVEDSIAIIGGIIQRYADHHQVDYDAQAIECAVKLSDRYVRERTLPDKAIGILDRAGSVARRQDALRVDREHIAQVVSKLADVAVERLLMEDRERFLKMERHLGEQLVGHDRIVERIARTIRRNYAGFASNRPIGSFLFLGPTGVGKTETVKVLADFLFGSRDALVRFDMSEFMEQHAVARLLGAPPGYVGFDDGGQLTEAVRRHPYQIVLLDEIEKAHPDVLNILLQLLDEGRLTDGKGRTVDFSNTVVVMTSNLGAGAVADAERGPIGFGGGGGRNESVRVRERAEQGVVDAARRAFPAELWNRIEERLVFHPLGRAEVARIAELQLADSARRLARERDIALTFAPELIAHLIDNGGFDPRYGARPMRKTIQRLVEAPVAEAILRSVLVTGDRARVFLEEDGTVLVEREPDGDLAPAVH